MVNDLKVLIPTVEIETTFGTIALNPFKFKDFPKALAIVNRYVEIFATAEDTLSIVSALIGNAGEQTLADISGLIELASGKDRTFQDELTYDEVVNLLTIIIEQNMDFFARIGRKLNKSKTEEEAIKTIETKQAGLIASVA